MKKIIALAAVVFAVSTTGCRKLLLQGKATTEGSEQLAPTAFLLKGDFKRDGLDGNVMFGFCLATNDEPTTNNTVIQSREDKGEYSCLASGLQSNTKYYYRAFITNRFGTHYGSVESFTTDYDSRDAFVGQYFGSDSSFSDNTFTGFWSKGQLYTQNIGKGNFLKDTLEIQFDRLYNESLYAYPLGNGEYGVRSKQGAYYICTGNMWVSGQNFRMKYILSSSASGTEYKIFNGNK